MHQKVLIEYSVPILLDDIQTPNLTIQKKAVLSFPDSNIASIDDDSFFSYSKGLLDVENGKCFHLYGGVYYVHFLVNMGDEHYFLNDQVYREVQLSVLEEVIHQLRHLYLVGRMSEASFNNRLRLVSNVLDKL